VAESVVSVNQMEHASVHLRAAQCIILVVVQLLKADVPSSDNEVRMALELRTLPY